MATLQNTVPPIVVYVLCDHINKKQSHIYQSKQAQQMSGLSAKHHQEFTNTNSL